MSKYRIVKKGEAVILTVGAYSDYVNINVYECLKDFDADEILVELGKEEVTGFGNKDPENIMFNIDAYGVKDILVDRGYLKLLETKELHLGEYGKIDIFREDYYRIKNELKSRNTTVS